MEASRGDVMATTNEEREMRVAVDRIVGFAKQFGEANLNLACHAAFPLVLTPDLLYQIWAHFVPEAPWTAVARVLLSRLCRQVGYEMYEMDIAVRNLLLRELKEQFGQERLDELGAFVTDYVAQRLTGDDPDWLKAHPEDLEVLQQYLRRIERQETSRVRRTEAITRTAISLEHHPEDSEVRKQYLILVNQHGTAKQQQEAIYQTAAWLQNNPDDVEVRKQYLALVKKHGTKKQL